MPYIKINNANIYFEEEGEGKETLIFGHSMLFNLRMFDDQVAFLKKYYRCIRFDFRGHGNTESTPSGYDLDDLTEDVAQLINKFESPPCHFVGFSMGGMVGLRMALKYPQLIKSLILIDTSSEPEPKSTMLKNKALILVVKYIGLKPIANHIMSLFFGKAFLNDPKRSALRKEWKNHLLSNNQVGIVKAVKGVLFRKGITHEISKIKHPTTVMVGEEDTLTDLTKANIIHNNIENSSLEIIPRAAHMSPVEESDFVNNLIKKHLMALAT